MKIAMFTDTFYPKVDGIVTSILNFSKELIKKGHEVIIFCPTYSDSKELEIKGLSVYRFFSFSLLSYKDVKIVLPNIIKIKKRLKKHKPDLIHIHTPGPLGYIGTIFSKVLKIPSAGTYHTLVSQQMMYISPANLLNIKKPINKIAHMTSPRIFRERQDECSGFVCTEDISQDKIGKKIAWIVSCGIYNNCDLVIVPSDPIKRILKEKGIKRRIITVSNGIHTDLFTPKKKYNKKIKKIIHVGRISFEKNVDRIIKAFSLLAKKYDHVNLDIIGGGPAIKSLKELSKKMGLSKRINFLGYISHNKLPPYYRESDFFVTCSTMETQGLVILEAMSAGIPTIGADAFAIPDIVKNGKTGFVFEPTDIKELADYMELLVKNPSLVENLGRNSLISARKHDLKKTSRLLNETYQKLIRK